MAKTRLNLMKKMEFEEDGNKDIFSSILMGLKGSNISPVSDCNSNNLPIPKENLLLYSTDSIHDCSDFLQDNSDYQWFLDYGYKENNYSHHQSILSLSRSQDLVYYEDMSRNFDANLAEVDMDDFNREDIHSVLSSLPNMQGIEEREMFASVSSSMMVKFDFETSVSPHSSSQEEHNNCSSVCKSQLLFSPVHESYLPNSNLSVDSLDISENDMNLMVTCQANKNNYTIAFEGSTLMVADDLYTQETEDSQNSTSTESEKINGFINGLRKNDENIHKCVAQSSNKAMTCSDSNTFTTWSKIKKNSNENLQLRRHASGNNNTTDDTAAYNNEIKCSSTSKSLSMPNLFHENQRLASGLSMSTKLDKEIGFSSFDREARCIKLYDIQNACTSKSADHSTSSTSSKPPHNFSLLKLFMKQKSGSHDGMSTYTKEDVLSCNTSKINNKQHGNISDSAINSRTDDCKKCQVNILQKSLTKKNEKGVRSKSSEGPVAADLLKKVDYKNEKALKTNYDLSSDNKYYSDESTQENGSNTESAEHLICNCASAPVSEYKKSLFEKSIQTSKLVDTSDENTQKPQVKVPVYILYPNYSLPNLEFLKKKHYVQNIDFSKVFIRPQHYQTPTSQVSSPKINTKRPFSVNDFETLKKTGFKHVRDWESLTFLLPKEYKEFLREIPEIVTQLKDIKHAKEDLVPLFCLSPPPNRKLKKRPISCDLNIFNNRSSNFSSIATQPSSGYRGSSTMLNSNNSNCTNSAKMNKNECNFESGCSRKSGSVNGKHNLSYCKNSRGSTQRPPLPKGILRNNSLDNHQYTCKTQKENANKRYSMIELSDRNIDCEEKSGRKRSSYNSHSARDSKNVEVNQSDKAYDARGNLSIKSDDNFYCQEQSKLQNDMRRLEELLEISSAFGENLESFTETDMMKLRSQVSRFLTMHKNLEKVSETLQSVDGPTKNDSGCNCNAEYQENNSLDERRLNTPHNTPEHKKPIKGSCEKIINREIGNLAGAPVSYSSDTHDSGTCVNDPEEDFCKNNEETLGSMKKTVSFAEKISSAVKGHDQEETENMINCPTLLMMDQKTHQSKCKRPIDLPICEESFESSLGHASVRRSLQISSELQHKRDLISDVKNAVERILKAPEDSQEDPANLCLHHLCPSLYAVLNDGLKEEIDTPFGPIKNSVWSVIEASSQKGPMTQTLNELVQRLNRDDIFTEGLIKFNAFIFGLLNVGALGAWLSYLRTRDSLLRKYYDSSGLLLMSNTAGALVRVLVDEFINILEPLCTVRFNLDLMYQTKLLHCSLQNLNHLLEGADNNAFLTPTKQFILMKLVQSIQNSISQSGEGKRSKHILDDIEQNTSDPPLTNLLNRNKNVVQARRGTGKARPRSGYDIFGQGKEMTDVTTVLKRRWSGVQSNSKLGEAFERLCDDSESDYTDSLDNPPTRKVPEKSSKTSPKDGSDSFARNLELEAEDYTKGQKKNILLNLNKKSSTRADELKTELELSESVETSSSQFQNSGLRFKRLQEKWEKLSGRSDFDSGLSVSPPESKATNKSNSVSTKCPTYEKSSCDNHVPTLPSPSSRISKIPRPVTSPLTSTPTTKSTGTSRKTTSPISPAHTNSNHRFPRPNSSLKISNTSDAKVQGYSSSRSIRIDEKTDNVEKGHAIRPTSLMCKGQNTSPPKKSEPISKRASSVSLNRKTTPKKLQHVPKTVRTLTHRLPSDSGHLSFNEGDKLKVVLEVDKTWLLCCRGTQKGLVPKSAVISDVEDSKF